MKCHSHEAESSQGRYLLGLPVSFHAHQVPSERGSTIKEKSLFQKGEILSYFPLIADPFSEEGQRTDSHPFKCIHPL